jgi:imidazolonepropionase-like amidohydrolase
VGGDVYTISGPVIRRGTVLLRDGKVWKVGVDLAIPEGAKTLGLEGKRVLPGFVGPDCEAAGLPPGAPKPGSLYRDALDPFSRQHELVLGSGVTSYYVTNGAGRGFLSTQTAVLRPAAGDASKMVLREPAAVWVNYAHGSATDRLGFEDSLRNGTRHLRDVEEARRAKRDPPKQPVSDEILAALRREIPVRVPATLKEEILDALRLAEVYGVRLVLEDATEAWLVPDRIARQGAVAIVTPREKMRDPRREGEPHGGNMAVAAILEAAGTKFCVLPVGGFTQPGGGFRLGGLAGRDMVNYPIEGAFAVRGGASEAAVLRAMTLGAAEALGVADRVGSIEPGRDADLIVLDGDPFHYRTVVDMALIEGKVYYERTKSSFFHDLPGR